MHCWTHLWQSPHSSQRPQPPGYHLLQWLLVCGCASFPYMLQHPRACMGCCTAGGCSGAWLVRAGDCLQGRHWHSLTPPQFTTELWLAGSTAFSCSTINWLRVCLTVLCFSASPATRAADFAYDHFLSPHHMCRLPYLHLPQPAPLLQVCAAARGCQHGGAGHVVRGCGVGGQAACTCNLLRSRAGQIMIDSGLWLMQHASRRTAGNSNSQRAPGQRCMIPWLLAGHHSAALRRQMAEHATCSMGKQLPSRHCYNAHTYMHAHTPDLFCKSSNRPTITLDSQMRRNHGRPPLIPSLTC